MNSYNINSTAEEGNDLALTPSQLNKPDNEASLHHDAVFGEISDEGPDYRSVGLIGTAGLMMKTQIGLGVLSIPATFNALGMIPGIICLLAVAVITTWSNWIVGLFKLRHRHVYAIDDAGEMMFGVVGKEFFGFAMWIYWVFVSGAGMLSLSIGLNAVSSHGACTAVFVAVAAVLGFGLSSIRTLARMSWLAWIGVISIMISVIMVTIATGVQERPAAAPQDGVWVSDYKLFNKPSFVQAASAICSLVSAFGGTPGFFAIVAEMRRPEQYTKALTICQAIVTVTYLTIGCVMYYFCGSYVSSPALGSAGDTIKKASYGVAIPGLIVSITLVTHLPSKYMFVRLLRNTKHLASNSAVHWSTWLGCTFIVSIIAYIIASAIPIFYSLISLIGALVGTLMCFQTMGFMWFYDNWEKRAISPKWLSACGWSLFVIASGTLLMVAEKAEDNVAIIARLANSIASRNPNYEDAQRRAQAATVFLQNVGITIQAPAANSSKITSASSREPQHSVKLPTELYRLIVGHVNIFRQQSQSREQTLVALSFSCKILNKLSEEFIHKHPGVLQNYYKQWKFLFSLKIRPILVSLVRSPLLDWKRQVENNEPVMDIITSYPNIEFLFVGNGGGNPGTVFNDQLQGLQFILATCTRIKSPHYFNGLTGYSAGHQNRIRVDDVQKHLSDWISDHTHVEQSWKQLQTLGLDGPIRMATPRFSSIPFLQLGISTARLAKLLGIQSHSTL
ncbi:hypothetical protein LZL87_010953 [Fusarium oxysporum]|nr:hypothetical protein LZL87_010953 [Fusarium oxysporum]